MKRICNQLIFEIDIFDYNAIFVKTCIFLIMHQIII